MSVPPDVKLLQDISKKLSVLIALGLQQRSGASVQDNVELLSRIDLTVTEIADLLGTSPGSVAVTKSRIKNRNVRAKGER
jgi:hypothetical protein